jgi:hypothetical protein
MILVHFNILLTQISVYSELHIQLTMERQTYQQIFKSCCYTSRNYFKTVIDNYGHISPKILWHSCNVTSSYMLQLCNTNLMYCTLKTFAPYSVRQIILTALSLIRPYNIQLIGDSKQWIGKNTNGRRHVLIQVTVNACARSRKRNLVWMISAPAESFNQPLPNTSQNVTAWANVPGQNIQVYGSLQEWKEESEKLQVYRKLIRCRKNSPLWWTSN